MKFGVREICDVTFKTTAAGQKVGDTIFNKAGMPAFYIDTAKTSSLEQGTTTVYAQGGKGFNRLIAWEGEKQMTFTVEDALISPKGLAVLSGAGLLSGATGQYSYVHMVINASVGTDGSATVDLDTLREETGLTTETTFTICSNVDKVPAYATLIDGSGAGVSFVPEAIVVSGVGEADVLVNGVNVEVITVDETNNAKFMVGAEAKGEVAQLDFYVLMANTYTTEIDIKPGDFGGFFYVEAQTLFRQEKDGKDMAAEIIIPKAKIQSNFTFSMAASGDPSTFTFVMDGFPAYTRFNKTKKVVCTMQIIGTDK